MQTGAEPASGSNRKTTLQDATLAFRASLKDEYAGPYVNIVFRLEPLAGSAPVCMPMPGIAVSH